jgi:hypothetical protein
MVAKSRELGIGSKEAKIEVAAPAGLSQPSARAIT